MTSKGNGQIAKTYYNRNHPQIVFWFLKIFWFVTLPWRFISCNHGGQDKQKKTTNIQQKTSDQFQGLQETVAYAKRTTGHVQFTQQHPQSYETLAYAINPLMIQMNNIFKT